MTDEPADHLTLQARLSSLQAKAHTEDLTNDELREILTISRTLRRTTAGPAKAKKAAAGKKGKTPLSDDDLSNLLG